MLFPSHVGFLQITVVADSTINLANIAKVLADLKPPIGAVMVIPELWGNGFDYPNLQRDVEKTADLLASLQQLAGDYGIILAGSLPEQAGDDIYNTLFMVAGSGVVGRHRKQHLFAPMLEDKYFSPGPELAVITHQDKVFGGLVCYDLRFPELARNLVWQGATVLLVCGQWPLARVEHWRLLLQARALENQVFVVACNRVGTTGNTTFGGHSMVVGPDGVILVEAGEQEVGQVMSLASEFLTEVRGRFNTVGPKPYNLPDCQKVTTMPELVRLAATYKKMGRRLVFTNGCFDIIHEGHITYLESARRQGDCLVVGLNSDSSIRAIKGPGRPVNSEGSRARILAGLGCVDHIVLFADDTPIDLITALLPAVLVKGADWPLEEIVGAKEVLANGGEVKTIEFVGDFSTTGLIAKIRSK